MMIGLLVLTIVICIAVCALNQRRLNGTRQLLNDAIRRRDQAVTAETQAIQQRGRETKRADEAEEREDRICRQLQIANERIIRATSALCEPGDGKP